MGECLISEQLCGKGTKGVGFDGLKEKAALPFPWWLLLKTNTSFPTAKKV